MNHKQTTRVVHAGEKRVKASHSLTTPIIQTSTYTFENTTDLNDYMVARGNGEPTDRLEYGRYGNPTVDTVQQKLADLEGGEAALLFASGMAAVTSAMLTFLAAGDHIIVTDDCYRRTRGFVNNFLTRFGVTVTQVPMGDYDALAAAVQPNTRLIFSESPTNPYLRILDLQKLVTIAKANDILTMIDSTFATPINQRPLEFGVDLVIHSASKYLGGHNDLLAGAVIGNADLVGQVKETQNTFGDITDANTAYLLLRGLKTLSLRVKHQNQTAAKVAKTLAAHPMIETVFYPGLETHPDFVTAKTQMDGFGGVVSFTVKADYDGTGHFVDQLNIPYIGPSLGGVESLVAQIARVSYFEFSSEERAAIGIQDNLIRYAVGVEDADDLVDDLLQALDALADYCTPATTAKVNGLTTSVFC